MSITITAQGHENVLGTHPTTLELTKDTHLTPQGDCIIGVNSDIGCADLPEEFKHILKTDKKFKVTLQVRYLKDHFIAQGHPDLQLTNEHDIVIRKSEFIDDRTLLIRADKAARDLNVELINALRNPEEKLIVTIKPLP